MSENFEICQGTNKLLKIIFTPLGGAESSLQYGATPFKRFFV